MRDKMQQQHDINDLESGARFRLNTDSYDDGIEAIPNLAPMEGNGTFTVPNADANNNDASLATSFSSSSTTATPEHNVIARMTTLEYLWRRHVRARTNNTSVQAMLDRILFVFLFLASLVERPLMYLLGNTEQTTKKNQPKSFQTPVTRGVTKTGLGAIAYIISQGRNPKKTPILCFHADKRSSDEFLEVLPLLADTGRRVVAIDAPGCGWSDNPRKSCTIDDIADAFIKVADALLIEQFVCLGSFTGTAIATSLASRYPNRVKGCIHVNLLYSPKREGSNNVEKTLPVSDELNYKDDGTHLIDLHTKRKFLDPDLNLRCIQSDLTRIVNQRARVVDEITMEEAANFDLESAARKTRCPTLCVSGESALVSLDARGLGGTQRFDSACRMLPHCEVKTLTGPRSTAYMINQAPTEFTSLCAGFLEKHSL
jgi:pimeloyl-ACP methyl ester carboxylesterase